MIELFVDHDFEVAAGVRQPLETYAATHEGYHVMSGAFMQIQQALAVPRVRTRAVPFVNNFIEEMKDRGFVATALARTGQVATVAPASAKLS